MVIAAAMALPSLRLDPPAGEAGLRGVNKSLKRVKSINIQASNPNRPVVAKRLRSSLLPVVKRKFQLGVRLKEAGRF